MKRSKVDIIFVQESKRRRKIIMYSFIIAIASLIAFSLLISYIKYSKIEYVKYNENSSIDYKVYLKENNFFKEKYLGKNHEYIASLIDYIDADFNYELALEQNNVDFNYSRSIEALVEVYDSNGKKPLYSVSEEILSNEEKQVSNKQKINIKENIKIDYNHYNDLIKEFKTKYELINTESILTIKMHININGNCSNLVDEPNTETIISLKIPLTTKTMSIEMESDLIEKSDGILVCKDNQLALPFLLLTISAIMADICFIIMLYRYIKSSRTSRDIYQKELKKILSNYHSFIQKINNNFDLNGYQVLKVDTFTDLLEIRDTLQQPILMVENKEKNGVHFITPSNTKILYVFTLRESEMDNKIKNSQKENKINMKNFLEDE